MAYTGRMASPAALSNVDLGDPSLWVDGPPYALLAELREHEPAHFSAFSRMPGEGGFWSLTRAEDVAAATRDFATFSSERRGIFLFDDIGVPLDVQRLQMISMDPPRHDRLKQLVGKAFTPKRIAEHEDHVRGIVTGVLDRFAPSQSVDLVQEIACPIPARVIGSLLGTPESDDQRLLYWTMISTAFEDPQVQALGYDPVAEMTTLLTYINAVREERAANPADDLLSGLMAAEVDGDRLTDLEIAVFFILLLSAGNDSTRSVYSAMMLELMRQPEQLQLLLDDPSLIPAAVEEAVRCFPAFAFMGRAATRDVELHGRTIREGDRVLLWYLASNRDPRRFADPERFDITRAELDQHQGFGAGGRHFCLGAGLARMELRIWLEETLARFPTMQLDGKPERLQSLFLNQYRSIPVRL